MAEKLREALTRFFGELLGILGEEGEVEVREEKGEVYVNLRGSFKTLPLEEKEFREALARLSVLFLKNTLRESVTVEIDLNGQEEARRKKLLAKVFSLAERVRAEKRSIELEPMSPKDRRLIHLALANFPGVRTYSVGTGEDRRVVIAPEEANAP
jgi:spoIIIJ-associated protein